MFDLIWGITISLQDNAMLLLVLMTLDIITGVIKGTRERSLRSTVMTLGIRKKGAMLVGITFSIVIDVMLFAGDPTFSAMFIILVMANEALSIVENLTEMGVPIPDFITKRLEVIKSQNSGNVAEKKANQVEDTDIENKR